MSNSWNWQLMTSDRLLMLVTGNLGDWHTVVGEVPWSSVAKTTMDCHSKLVLHSLRNNHPVQVVVHQPAQIMLILLGPCEQIASRHMQSLAILLDWVRRSQPTRLSVPTLTYHLVACLVGTGSACAILVDQTTDGSVRFITTLATCTRRYGDQPFFVATAQEWCNCPRWLRKNMMMWPLQHVLLSCAIAVIDTVSCYVWKPHLATTGVCHDCQ